MTTVNQALACDRDFGPRAPMRRPKPPLQAKARSSERGFALLLIFFMAAGIALMLYTQMPRVAFESERNKEQILIDRGEQYKRAILLYYNDYKRFPGKIEDLENTNNHRYLRRRYVDPYTGKDEWRLVHTNGMYLTDSLVQKPPANPANSPTGSSQSVTASAVGPGGPASGPIGAAAGAVPSSPPANSSGATTNPNDPNNPPQVNAAVFARPSDRPLVPAGGFQGSFPTASNTAANSGYIDPASYPPITLFPNGYNASAGGTQPGVGASQGAVQPGVPQPGGFQAGAQPGFTQPGFIQQSGLNQPGQFQPGVAPTQFQQGATPITGNATFQPYQPPVMVPQPQITPTNFLPGVPLPPVPGGFAQGAGASPDPNNPNLATPTPLSPNVPFDPNNNGANNGLNNGANQNPGFNPNQPVVNQPGFNQPGLNQPGLPTNAPGLPNQQFPNQAPGAGNTTQALNLINQLLTTPRQPPPAAGAAGASNNNNQVGGGIAGVASTFTGATIKKYADRTQYQEWEFIFQLQQQGAPGQAANPLGAQGTNGANPNAPGTGQSGIGSSGIGQPSITQPGIGQPSIGQPGIGGNGQPNIGPNPNFGPGLPPLQ